MSDKSGLPIWDGAAQQQQQLPAYEPITTRPRSNKSCAGRVLLKTSFVALLAFLSLASIVSHRSSSSLDSGYRPTSHPHVQDLFARSLDRCAEIAAPAGPPPNFHSRTVSDRYEEGTRDILIRNATIWTGGDEGNEVLRHYDVHVSKGIIKKIAKSRRGDAGVARDVDVIDAAGRWLTPGLIDMHVHLSGSPSPVLSGAEDINSIGANINPWLRVADGANQHDVSLRNSISGGITTGLLLPGSANSMGGQAFPLKYRDVSSLNPADRILDPPTSLGRLGGGRNLTSAELAAEEHRLELTGMARNDSGSSWRHMKMAYGENPRRVYSKTRMDTSWDVRQIFDEARTLKQQQDSFCAKAKSFAAAHGPGFAPAESEAAFPESLRLEALVDLLRGKVKLNQHNYLAQDFLTSIRHTNEFEYEISAWHHASSAYLFPDLLRQQYGGKKPAVAIFSANFNYKLEAYFGSPFAGAILDSHDITPVYKSDHPVTDSRRILNQAAQGHHFGLNERAALRSVISAPAEKLGLDHRIGFVKQGWDADLVLWNNHPLNIGATPVEVVVDGIRQLGEGAHTPAPFFAEDADRRGADPAPPAVRSGNFTADIEVVKRSGNEISRWEKDPFPVARKTAAGCAVLRNVSKVYAKGGDEGKTSKFSSIQVTELGNGGVVVVDGGKVVCQGTESNGDCANACADGPSHDLRGGVVTPGLTSYGADLGLTDIVAESEASDGSTLQPLGTGSDNAATQTAAALRRWPLARAADGLAWGGHDLKRARASGVTSAVVAPQSSGFFSGISVRFDTGAETVLDEGAVSDEEVGVHVKLSHNEGPPSVSEQVGWIRKLLSSTTEQDGDDATAAGVWRKVARGELPLIVTALKASQIATLLKLSDSFPSLRMVLVGASEAHLVASEIAKRNVSVLLTPQTWPRNYDELHSLVGPPLTAATTLSVLLEAGVKVGLKIEEGWQASNLLTDSVRAALETNGLLDKRDALALVSSSVEEVLGVQQEESIVAWDGEPFEYGVKVVAVAGKRGFEEVTTA